MNVLVTSRGRRLLPLLAMGCVFAGWPGFAQADLLTSRLTDRASLARSDSDVRGSSARVVFASQEPEAIKPDKAELARQQALAALALILVVPAGTMPMIAEVPTPPPPPPPQPQQTTPTPTPTDGHPTTGGSSTNGGTTGGHISGGPTPTVSNPEPGSLVLALTGSGTALLAWLRRRRSRVAPLCS
jgi:hypothetical protein